VSEERRSRSVGHVRSGSSEACGFTGDKGCSSDAEKGNVVGPRPKMRGQPVRGRRNALAQGDASFAVRRPVHVNRGSTLRRETVGRSRGLSSFSLHLDQVFPTFFSMLANFQFLSFGEPNFLPSRLAGQNQKCFHLKQMTFFAHSQFFPRDARHIFLVFVHFCYFPLKFLTLAHRNTTFSLSADRVTSICML
jgi:hypothetical protein